MEPLERYLATTRSFLPQGQAEDILLELRDHLLSLMEEQESALGRPLSPAEEVALLNRHGHPMEIAAGYRADDRCLAFGPRLIGPALFPFYLKVLRLSLSVVLGILAVAACAELSAGQPSLGRSLAFNLVTNLVLAFVVVTGIFIVLDRRRASLGKAWDPGGPGRPAREGRQRGPSVRFKAGAAFAATGLYLLFWLAFPGLGAGWLLGPGAFILDPGPGWPYWHQAGTALLLGHLGLAAFTFALPKRPLLHQGGDLLLQATGIGLLGWGLRHGAWRVVAGGEGHLLQGQPLAQRVNEGFRTGLPCLVALLTAILLLKAWKLRQRLQ